VAPEAEALETDLDSVLPRDLPNREMAIRKCARHLVLIDEANRHFNLTRITDPREAAIKHVLDSVIPWRLFAHAAEVLDAGTGAGFPGIPLAVVLPDTRFTLAESIQKKARFVESTVAALELPNVRVVAQRAEEIAQKIITARSLAPISRAIQLFAPALRAGAKLLLYKGPNAEQEMTEAVQKPAGKLRPRMRVAARYELPESSGTRLIVEICL
jgi:16S rRNA (guanine527-N7)-methyltransferase